MPGDSSPRWDKGETLQAANREVASQEAMNTYQTCLTCSLRTGVYDKESVSQEPCASKEASTVLKPSGGGDLFA
jgi:sulfur relay (sulfurtransferase) complex TusBCD TusD component (DsrE family)